jgi:hypothetical protein
MNIWPAIRNLKDLGMHINMSKFFTAKVECLTAVAEPWVSIWIWEGGIPVPDDNDRVDPDMWKQIGIAFNRENPLNALQWRKELVVV